MKINKRQKKGMAIVIVLLFSSILLAYGSIMMRQHQDAAPVSKVQLDRIQADFFAKGIQNIALFKIKKFPDFFLRSYRKYALGVRNNNTAFKTPFTSNFMIDDIFGRAGSKYWTPLKLDHYNVEIRLLNSEDFNNETIEVSVEVQFPGKAVNKYVAVFNGDMKQR